MASREEDQAMAGLLRKSLAADAGARAENACPAPEILAAYFEHALAADEIARYDLHFSQCSRCREQLAALARASGEIEGRKAAASGWNWLRAPGWLMPAAAAFAVLVLIAGITSHKRKTVEVASEIAVARPESEPAPAPAGSANGFVKPIEPAASPAPPASANRIAPSRTASAPVDKPPNSAYAGVPPPNERKKETRAAAQPQSENAPAAPAALPAPLPGAISSGADKMLVEVPPPTSAETVEVVPGSSQADASAESSAASATAAKAKHSSASKTASSSARASKSAAAAAAAGSLPAASSSFAERSVRDAAEVAKMQQAQMSSSLAAFVVQTPDPNVIWMISYDGSVARSEDAGASWKYEPLETGNRLVAGSAPTAKICWLVAERGAIYRTTDGKAWTSVSPPDNPNVAEFVRIEAKDASSATVTTADGRKFSTADGGKSWTLLK
jgi:hypothetical protein